MSFFDAIKNLFTHSRAFQLFVDNNKRKLIKGLSFLPENTRQEAELVYFDIFPDSTRYPEKWEEVFGIIFVEAEQEKKREILNSLWARNNEGQSGAFLEEVLQRIIPEIRVIENIPVKNPRDGNVAVLSINGHQTMVCGNNKAVNYFRVGDSSFIPTVLQNDTSDLYSISDNPKHWETCFYICHTVERNSSNKITFIRKINIEKRWKNYIEYIILKIKPVHTTAVLYIEWEE